MKIRYPLTVAVVTLLMVLPSTTFAQRTFVHPGITHKRSDLDRMKHMVLAQIDPWFSSYQEMAADSKSSYMYTVRGDPSFTELGRDNGVNYSAWNSDIRAAYYNAIRWYVTGDSRHADKAIEIFNAWRGLTAVTSNGTQALSGGVGYIMIEAAEIIKNTYDGWAASEIQDFKDMLVYPGYSNTAVPAGVSRTYGTFYWQAYQGDPGRHGNQGLSGWRTVMAMGIFLDNEIMYDRALRYIKGLPHRPDDLPYPSGPSTHVSLQSSTAYVDTWRNNRQSSIADYGYNEVMTNYIYANGQCQESSRDQQHTFFGVGLLCSMAEMAWNQGEDLYSHENDRLLLGLEYNMRYNVSFIQSYPDQLTPWEPTVASGEFEEGFDRTHRWYSKAISPDGRGGFSNVRPVFEMPVAHYLGRGFKTEAEVKWTLRARDKAIEESGYEVQGWSNDAIGWGGLSARRPAFCYGDPVSGFSSNMPVYAMHVIPCTIEAENYDAFTVSGEGHTYHDLTPANSGGAYRTDEGVDISACSEGGYALTAMEDGEWLSYTFAVPSTSIYDISIRYAAAAPGGKISFSVNGTDRTGELDIPFGVPNSTGMTDWQDLTIASGVFLGKGVHNLRIHIGGTSSVFELDHFAIRRGLDPLSAHWKLDEGSGTAASDSASGGYQGTVANAVWMPDQLGGALDFNGSSSVVNIPASAFEGVSREISIAMWVYGGDLQPLQEDSIFYAVNAADQRVLNIHLPWSNGQVYWDAGFSGTYDRINKTASSDQFMGQWNHWVFTKNADSGSMKIYHNGKLWHSDMGKTRSINPISQAAIGAQFTSAWYDGMIGDVQLFNVSLTDCEVSNLHQSGLAYHTPVIGADPAVSNGQFSASFSGSIGEHYVLEGAESLTNAASWQVVTDITTLGTSPLQLEAPATNAAGFYRVRWIP